MENYKIDHITQIKFEINIKIDDKILLKDINNK